MNVRFVISVSLLFIALVTGIIWASRYQERTALTIRAHSVPELAKPVYAQYVYTQTFALPDISDVTAIHVPLYIPDPQKNLHITLYRNEKKIYSWDYHPMSSGMVQAQLDLNPSQLLDGKLELEFNGQTISHQEESLAPRIFVETADEAYPDGNYRIARNQKQGDIALSVLEQKKNIDLFFERMFQKPFLEASKLGYILLAMVLVVSAPYTLTLTRSTNMGT